MKSLILGVLLLFLTGCGNLYYGKRTFIYTENGVQVVENIGFWDQEVLVTGYGFTMLTAYGPFNFGYMQWQRNIKNPKDPATPNPFLQIK